jgi:hypothetical protein
MRRPHKNNKNINKYRFKKQKKNVKKSYFIRPHRRLLKLKKKSKWKSIHIQIQLLLIEKKTGSAIFFYNILISSAFFIIIYYSGVFIRCFWYPSTLTLKIFSLFIIFTLFLLAILDDKLSCSFLDHHLLTLYTAPPKVIIYKFDFGSRENLEEYFNRTKINLNNNI